MRSLGMAGAGVMFFAAAGMAQTEADNLVKQDFRDWTVVRVQDGQAGCLATIAVGLRQRDSGLASVTLYRRADTEAEEVAVMTARVPLGASLASGIAYLHPGGEEAVGLAWQYCDDRTCLASGGVTQAELARLKAGNRIYLGFTPLPGSRALVVPVSLLGFTRSWNALESC